ncbi:MAG: hypothetical protein U0174_21915 [Polyangiaceae bacterium]
MKLSPLYTSLVALAVTFAGPIGCAAEASDDAADEPTSDDDLTAGPSKSKLLGEVVSIKVDDKTIGAKSKVTAILKAMKLGATDALPQVTQAIPRCMFAHPIAFYGASDKLLGSGGFMCGAQQTTGTATAYVYVGTKAYSMTADLGNVFKQVQKPVQASDLLYGITNFSVTKPGPLNPRGTGSEPDTIKMLLSAVGDKVTAIDPNAPTPRCMPARIVTFYRGTKEAATITSMCSADTGMSTGTLSEADGDKVGTLSLNMATLAKVESKLRWTR